MENGIEKEKIKKETETNISSQPFIYEFVYKFKEDIDRVSSLVRNLKLWATLLSIYSEITIESQSDSDTWSTSSKFKVNCKKIKLMGNTVNFITQEKRYKIKREFRIEGKGVPFTTTTKLMKLSEENSTICYLKYIIPSDYFGLLIGYNFEEERKKMDKEISNVFSFISKMLEKSGIEQSQFESCIIKGKMESIKNLLKNPVSFKIIAPELCYDMQIEKNTDNNHLYLKLYPKDSEHFYYCKSIQESITPTKILLSFESINGNIKRPYNIFTITIIQANPFLLQLSFLHEFKEHITNEEINEIKVDKVYLLKCLKDYIENFCYQ